MALRAAEALDTTVTVAAGIHYDDLRKEDIAKVVEQAWRRFTIGWTGFAGKSDYYAGVAVTAPAFSVYRDLL